MVPEPKKKKKKPKKPMPLRGHMKPTKPKKPNKGKSAVTGPAGIGGTLGQISCTLSFSQTATAVSISVGALEPSVTGVNVYWDGNSVFTTTLWNDPGLQAIAAPSTPAAPVTLRIKVSYGAARVYFKKTDIYPTGGGILTVTLWPE